MNTRIDNPFLGRPVAVIGAGVMGVGIVQVAALAGHPVLLHDMREGAAEEAIAQLGRTLDGLVAKGRLDAELARAARGRIQPAGALGDLAAAALVIEAIVENLAVKQQLLRDLEAVVAPACVLASNTSSLSITALARGLARPGRVVGMHFFNPVPLMKLVEVVSGLATDAEVAAGIHALSAAWGKTPVHARSTPGFIVNRIARPFYAETLALLQDQAAAPAVLDACVRGSGFRMGPCELMDLIGHDTNLAVTQAVYEANFQDKRYQPSLVQRELVDGGRLGRKSLQGFFRYGDDVPSQAFVPAPVEPAWLEGTPALCGHGAIADALAARLQAAGHAFTRDEAGEAVGLRWRGAALWLTDGRCAAERARAEGLPRLAVFDLPADARAPADGTVPLAYAVPAGAALADDTPSEAAWAATAAGLLRALGWAPVRVADVPGLVVARTIAMLVNEACDAVNQGVCDEAGADAAMKLGVNYPAGPFEWLARWGVAPVVRLLDALDAFHRGERYRVSPGLRRRQWRRPAAH